MKNLIPIVLIFLSVGLFFLVIDPQYREVKNLRAAGETYTKVLENSSQVKKKKDELLKADALLRANTPNEERLLKLLPRRVESIKFILMANNIALQHRLSLKNIHVDQGGAGTDDKGRSPAKGGEGQAGRSTGGLYVATGFGFSIQTSYDTFRAFLRDLEESLTLMDVTSLSLKSLEGNLYDISISGTIYSLE